MFAIDAMERDLSRINMEQELEVPPKFEEEFSFAAEPLARLARWPKNSFTLIFNEDGKVWEFRGNPSLARNVGRNDLCKCNSGLKTKRCCQLFL